MKTHYKYGLVFLFGLIYALLFGELFVRFMKPQPLLPRYVTGSPWGVRANIANATYNQSTPEVSVNIKINSQGMRSNREYSINKPVNVCRIQLFGDSFFMGYEVNIEDSIAYLLEKQIKAAGYNAEVLNLSVSGFGTAEMLRTFEAYGSKFQPDVVVFQWHYTDIDDNLRSQLYRIDESNNISTNNQSYLPAIKVRDMLMQYAVYRWLIENSHLYSVVRETAAGWAKKLLVTLSKKPKENKQETVADSKQPEQKNYAHTLTAKLLDHSKEQIEKNGASWLLFEIPNRVTRTKFESVFPSLENTSAVQAAFVSPLEDFSKIAEPNLKLYFEKGHSHLTPIANEVAAKRMAKAIIDKQLLKSECLM